MDAYFSLSSRANQKHFSRNYFNTITNLSFKCCKQYISGLEGTTKTLDCPTVHDVYHVNLTMH